MIRPLIIDLQSQISIYKFYLILSIEYVSISLFYVMFILLFKLLLTVNKLKQLILINLLNQTKRYMLTIQEILTHIQSKIATYRQIQHKSTILNYKLKQQRQTCHKQAIQYKQSIIQIINLYKKEITNNLISMSTYYENMIHKIKKECQLQIDDINKDRERQYNCIRKMKDEIFSLQQLINYRNLEQQQNRQYINHEQSQLEQRYQDNRQDNERNNNNMYNQTINGLQIITEEQTQRTIVSSVRSYNDQYRYTIEPFIKIQEKSITEFQYYDLNAIKTQKQSLNTSQVHKHDTFPYQINNNQYQFQREKSLSKSQSSSMRKLQKLLADSNVENRQNTHQYQFISDQSYGQYESLPLSVQGCQNQQFQSRQDCHTWNSKKVSKELRDITNQGHDRSEMQRQRQQKTKMFLQQFRKTFSKCLSSATISRKSSLKEQKVQKVNKSKEQRNNKTLKDISCILKDNDKIQNQKMINEMLKDIDNNNKFLIGNRKIQLKYQGQRKDGVRNGKGILYYSNGLCYQGQFKNNLRHGSGILRFNLVQLYRGEWVNDELSGQGRLRNFAVINNKRNHINSNSPLQKWGSYYGFFKNNRFQGQGTLYLSGGEKFLGKFICGMACGQGILYKKSGEVENGIWRNNQLVERF